jgi:hypothetical protein
MSAKGRQISVRVRQETDLWLERRAGGRSHKADFVRRLIEREMAREREESLLDMFNRAASDVTPSDRAEREQLLGAFAAKKETSSALETTSKRKNGP